MSATRSTTTARVLTNVLNPFAIFTALYVLVAFAQATYHRALLYIALELLAAAAVAGYVFMMRRRARAVDFWLSARTERLEPAVFLMLAFAALLGGLVLLGAPGSLSLLTLSMGLASGTIALVTLRWKASAHCTVAGHAAVAGVLLLGPPGGVFVLALPLVVWARTAPGAHSFLQALAGAAVGAAFAALSLI